MCSIQKYNKQFSELIRAQRAIKGYSQEYIASKIGITQPAYSNLEKRPLNMSVSRLITILMLLELPFDVISQELKDESKKHKYNL